MMASSRMDGVAVISHVLNPEVRAMFERVLREAGATHDVRFILSSDDAQAGLAGTDPERVERITRADIVAPGYPEKSRLDGWDMAGNLDLVFLEFRRRHPELRRIWFLEYDVHWQGDWSVFLNHFAPSPADVLAATMQQIDEVAHKEGKPAYPRQVVPSGMPWERRNVIKGFLPAVRLSTRALDALDAAYRAGLGGHYEINVPSVAAQCGLVVEDFGGDGRYVRPENRNRFYFARGGTYSHSPGTFVFRPPQRVLPRPNTLWHPVKPGGVPAWHPLRIGGSLPKMLLERAKPLVWHAANWLWFATRWRPLDGRRR
jgi:hypothetical protein